MKDVSAYFTSGQISAVGTTTQTVLQLITTSTCGCTLVSYSISFDGTTALSAPAVVRILRQTTAPGTPGASAVVPKIARGNFNATIATTYDTGNTGSEPTGGDVIRSFTIPSFMGTYAEKMLVGIDSIDMPVSTRLGFEITAQATVNVRVDGTILE